MVFEKYCFIKKEKMNTANLKKYAGQVLIIAVGVTVGLFIHSMAQSKMADRKMLKSAAPELPAIEE